MTHRRYDVDGSGRSLIDFIGPAAVTNAMYQSQTATAQRTSSFGSTTQNQHAAKRMAPANDGSYSWLPLNETVSSLGSAASGRHMSLTRVPTSLRNLGVSCDYTPGGAVASRHGLNQSPTAGSRPSTSGSFTAANRPLFPHDRVASSAPNDTVATDAQLAETNTVPPAVQQRTSEAETRAQLFYRRLQEAAKRELLIAEIKSPTRNGMVVGREKNPLQFSRVALKEPGAATQRLAKVHRKLFDQMIHDTSAMSQNLKDQSASFNALNAAHVAIYAASASPAASLARNAQGMATAHTQPLAYNPYCPRSAAPPRLCNGVEQPLLVAVPDHEDCPLSPVKGAVGTLAISAQPTSYVAANRNDPWQTCTELIERRADARPRVVWDEDVSASSSHPTAEDAVDSAQLASHRPLSDDDKATLLHACRFVVDAQLHRITLFRASYDFEKAIGLSEAATRKLLLQMERQWDAWDTLALGSLEHTVVLRLLGRLLEDTAWLLPNVRLPSGCGGTSKLRVSELYRVLSDDA